MKLRSALLSVLLVLCVHIIAIRLFDLYRTYPDFDIPMHFFGGYSVGLVAYVYIRFVENNNRLLLPPLTRFLFVWGSVAIIATGWEWMEFVGDILFPATIKGGLPMQASLQDTMGDLFLGGFGSWCAFFWGALRERKEKISHVGKE